LGKNNSGKIILLKKIKSVPIKNYLPEYNGNGSYESGCEFFKQSFEGRNRNESKVIYTHVTCATDTDNISAVFNSVKDIILRKSLNEAGL